jgi:hypothetical protein
MGMTVAGEGPESCVRRWIGIRMMANSNQDYIQVSLLGDGKREFGFL